MDIWLSTFRSRMAENTLDDQDIDIVVVEMGSQAVPQCMAGNVKRSIYRRVKQDFFKIIFHFPDCQTVSLFGDKQCRCEPAVIELITHGKVLAKDRASSRVNTYEIMTKPAVCVDPDMDIRYCSRLMSSLKLTRILVVKDNALLGTVNPRSLVLDGLVALEADD